MGSRSLPSCHDVLRQVFGPVRFGNWQVGFDAGIGFDERWVNAPCVGDCRAAIRIPFRRQLEFPSEMYEAIGDSHAQGDLRWSRMAKSASCGDFSTEELHWPMRPGGQGCPTRQLAITAITRRCRASASRCRGRTAPASTPSQPSGRRWKFNCGRSRSSRPRRSSTGSAANTPACSSIRTAARSSVGCGSGGPPTVRASSRSSGRSTKPATWPRPTSPA